MHSFGHYRLGRFFRVWLAGFVLTTATLPAWSQSNAGKLDLLMAELHEDLIEEWPEQATLLGYHEQGGRWTDWSLGGIRSRRLLFSRYLESLRGIPQTGFAEETRLNRRLCERALLAWIEELEFDPYYFRLNPINGVHLETVKVLNAMPRRSIEDYEQILGRLTRLPRRIAESIRLSEEGMSRGWTLPRYSLEQTLAQIEDQLSRSPEDSPLLRSFRSFPDTIPAEDQERISAHALLIYGERIAPAWRRLREHVAGPALQRSRDSLGLAGLPNGAAIYASMISRYSSVPWTARQLHEFGQEEVRRVREDVKRWQNRQDLPGTMEQLVRQMRDNKQFQFRSSGKVISEATKFTSRVKQQLPLLFADVPAAALVVRPMPERLPMPAPSLYRPAPVQSPAPAQIFLRMTPRQMPRTWELPVILLHEGWPGHHLQVSSQMNSEAVEPFRAFYPVVEYSEGWAHYAESLGSELGAYQDPYAEFGRLQAELLRAARLVADTGVNAFGWNSERCNSFFRETLGVEPAGELDRYISLPGQALAYKLGENRLRRLRQRASERLGVRFDAREFHNAVLKEGMIPLDLLEERVDRWIDREDTETDELPSQP